MSDVIPGTGELPGPAPEWYAGQIMTWIAADAARGFALASAVNLPVFYLAKAGVPAAARPAVCEQVARRLKAGN